MAPGVDLTTCATPGLPLAARAEDGHLMVELLPRLQALPTASTRNSVKFAVVPEESDWTDLKAAMASCWKVSWNVDRLALSVPLRLAEPPDDEEEEEPLLGGELLLDEEHAPRVSASATTETPAAVTCCLYRSCISQY